MNERSEPPSGCLSPLLSFSFHPAPVASLGRHPWLMNLGTVTESALVGPDKAALRHLPCCLVCAEVLAQAGLVGEVGFGGLGRRGWQGRRIGAWQTEPVNSRAFWHIVEALDDFEKCLCVFSQVQLFLPL